MAKTKPNPKTNNQDELFDADFLDRLRAIFLRLRKRRQLRKKGVQSTQATGFTREFKDYRHYTRNDDYRAIDWRLYARLEKLFIRLYEEVQELHIHILLDTSNSMASPYGEKRQTALKLGVALAYLGLVGQHKVSLYSMADKVVEALPPMKGQGNIQKVIDFAKGLHFGEVTDLEKCFAEFRPSRQRFGIVFVVSDLFGKEIGSATSALRRASSWPGETHIIHVHHPREQKPDLDGEVELIDSETKEVRRLWFTKRELKRYEEAFEGFISEIQQACLSRQVDYLRWRTDQPFEDLFLDLLSQGSALAGS